MSEKYLFFTVTDLNRTRDELEQDELYGISAFYDFILRFAEPNGL